MKCNIIYKYDKNLCMYLYVLVSLEMKKYFPNSKVKLLVFYIIDK
jgi:hypothetical protein